MAETNFTRSFQYDGIPPRRGFSKVIARGDCSNHTLMCLAKGSDITEHTSSSGRRGDGAER